MEGYGKALKAAGFNYLGGLKKSAKMMKSYIHNTATYCVYLAPANMAGRTKKGTRINVCPKSQHCKELCLNSAGHNKADILSNGKENIKHSLINISRIKKTKLFYNDRDLYMDILIHEINRDRSYAERHGMEFSVRLNGTSDLSPEIMKKDGKNILEIFPDVQFYDYTKVYNRTKLMKFYPNYDITFSYDGYNWDQCEQFLNDGGKVAVVFDSETMPKTYKGYKVIDANGYDMRYLDPKGCIMGLEFHPIAKDGKVLYAKDIDDPFVVKTENNTDVVM
jgi:hypothetical protein